MLEKEYKKCPKYDVKIIIGDFNAKVGREEVWKPIIGKHSLHTESNDNGTKLISFATSLNMVIGSTLYPHRDIHKGTWKSPDGNTVNQIDHVLIDRLHVNNLQDVRNHIGVDINSDHYLVIVKIIAKINRQPIIKKKDRMEKI